MTIKATAAPGAIIALPRNKAHVVKGHSESGNYEALCGKVIGPAAQEQADDSNICGNCKRLNAAVEPEQAPEEAPAPTEHTAPVAPRPEPVNAYMPVLADKLVLPDTDELARATDPDNNDPRARLGVLELGKDRIPTGPARRVSGREPRPYKPLPEKEGFPTPIGSRLNDPGNQVGGTATTSPDPVIPRVDGAPVVPLGKMGTNGSKLDPECVTLDVVGGLYGWLTITAHRAAQEGMNRNQRRAWRKRYTAKVKQNKRQGIKPLHGQSRKVVPIESVRGAK